MLGLGLALTNFGSKGGISDVADGGLLSSTFLSTYGPYGMAMDFTDASIAIDDSTGVLDYNSQGTVSATTGALLGPGSKLTYSAPSAKLTEQADGYLAFQAHNLYLNSAAPANQSITVISGATYAITITGSVSVTASGAATGTWTAGTNTFTAATGTLTCGSTSGSGTVHLRRTPSVSTYVATTSAIVYDLPYVYSSGVKTGIMVEQAATNLCLYSRDLTNAAWIKTSASAALTATGIDGIANSASTLTATSANGVAIQNISSASAARSVAISLKRRTGTGTVTISHGATTGSTLVTNGTFASDVSSWTSHNSGVVTFASGTLQVQESGNANPAAYQAVTVTAGKMYKLTGTSAVTGGTGSARVSVYDTAPATTLIGTAATTSGAAATGSLVFRASDTQVSIVLIIVSASAGATATFDNIELLEVAETDVTSSINADTWTRVSILNETITNPAVCIKLATSGDAVDVDIAQTETGTVATSPIITYGGAGLRVGDDITLATSLVPSSATEGTIFAHAGFVSAASASTAVALFSVSNGTTTEMVYMRGFSNNPQALVHDSANNQTIDAGTWPGSGDVKMATAWAASDSAASLNGGAAVANGSSGTPTLTTFRVGGAHTASSQYGGLIKLVASFPVRKANATLEGMSTL